ncbi:MAG TPA: NAD(P)H-dependent oxidoreductase subunit E [Candidatus Dormibacteraeota bacterium]|nr:NAD(P)H-dependent oxidoreductase subunit E [Candidatus Dormibacteraeota bacterium]
MQSFETLYERLRPECERLIAQYEHPRSALLPIVHLFQQHEGYASREAMRATAEMLELTPAVVESTVSFYSLFFRKPVGRYVLQVCRGLSCTINGAEEIMAYFREKLGIGHLQTTADGLFSYEEVECLAACDRPTCMQVNLEFFYDLTPAAIDEMIEAMRGGAFSVAPIAQTRPPESTWAIKQDDQVATGRKSPGATDVARPNNAGGLGDASGVIMLDRFVNKEIAFSERSNERLVRDSRAVYDVLEDGEQHAGH